MTRKLVRGPLWAALVAVLAAALLLLASFGGAQSARAEPDRAIVGGTAVPDGKYEFMAALLDTNNGSTPFEQQFCGGTLIDGDSVLTAAHCVVGERPGPLRVTVGRTVLNSDQGQLRRVSRIYVHPRYNRSTLARDAAVLELGSPVFGIIAPINLATSGQIELEQAGRYATAAGWGNVNQQSPDGEEPNAYANRMREVRVPIVSDAEQVYDRPFGPTGYTRAIHVAAGEEGKDSCDGDSGGPLFAETVDGYTQIGITSFGVGCGARGYPNVYAEVNSPAIRDFITTAAAR